MDGVNLANKIIAAYWSYYKEMAFKSVLFFMDCAAVNGRLQYRQDYQKLWRKKQECLDLVQ